MGTIKNPILRGFNPDPSILRVGDDYYIATSTFEWYPGVQIHHSKDLIHWRLLTHPLTRRSQLDMTGNPTSGGIWAPCLSYDKGTFYLIYTDVKTWQANYKDCTNYLTTATNIEGPWSEPIFLNSSGFDASLFHDDDGRKWLVNMLWDHRKGRNPFAGILLQEYSPEEKRLVGPIKNIFQGTPIGLVEGPHLYKRNGYYYLLTAEGGTQYEHAATMARSTKIDGPYEVDPENPILTSNRRPELALQKAGHASIVETQTGEWYMVHLCGRPVKELRCNLGRETSIQRCQWTEDGWFQLENGTNSPQVVAVGPQIPEHPFPAEPARDDFNNPELSVHYATLRVLPDSTWLSLTEHPGYLRLRGRESLNSRHSQSLVVRRMQAFHCEASTCVEFEPETFQQMAGLVAFYEVDNYYYLRISRDEMAGKSLAILTSIDGRTDEPLEDEVSIEGWDKCYLKVEINREQMQFYYSADGQSWEKIGPVLDASTLADEFAGKLKFTGSMLGVCVQDLSGRKKNADFDFFEYRELE
jgi:xylan 1,4-beta-xylosidase